MRIMFIGIAVLGLGGCVVKESEFFATDPGGNQNPLDITPPIFVNYWPPPTFPGPFKVEHFAFDVQDPAGSNGVPPSGVNFNSLIVNVGGSSVPFTRDGDRIIASLAGIPDGQILVNLAVNDNQGNPRTGGMTFVKKTKPPTVTFTQTPPTIWQSSKPSEVFTYTGTVMDPFLGSAFGALYQPGEDGQCGTADDQLFPVGSGPGEVSQNMWTYNIGASGSFSMGFTAFNPVQAGEQAQDTDYCYTLTSQDRATNGEGASDPNVNTVNLLSRLTWQPPPATDFNLSLALSYCHFAPQNSGTKARFQIQPIPLLSAGPGEHLAFDVAGAPWTIQWSGPGTVGATQRSGVLDANGEAVDNQPINLFGTYTAQVSVTVDGKTKTATGSVNVTSAQGTGCT